MAGVTLSYKGGTLAQLTDSGTKTVQTHGMYCEDDLLIHYSRPGSQPPAAIEIVRRPKKAHYQAGDTIDYTGISVRTVNEDGTTFTDETYPDGRIPFEELVFPVETASFDSDVTVPSYSGRDGWPSLSVLNPPQNLLRLPAGAYHAEFLAGGTNNYVHLELESAAYLGVDSGYRERLCIVSDGPIHYSDSRFAQRSTTTTLEINGQTYHGLCKYDAPWEYVDFLANVPSISGWLLSDQEKGLNDLLCMIYGNVDFYPVGIIPVRWFSPYTQDTFETSFAINAAPPDTTQITQNGTHDVYDYSFAEVNVQPPLQAKTITQNGFFTPDSGYYGLSGVEVNVPEGERGYELLEYIESNGTQGIDTGRKIPANSNILCTFLPKSGMSGWLWAFGAEYSTGVYAGLQIAVQDGTSNTYNGTSNGTNRGAIRYAPPIDCMSVVTTANSASTANLWIFALGRISGTGYSSMSKIRLYYCKCGAWTFLPCRRKNDGVCGLWDAANGVFLTDTLGGDPFAAGPVVFG